MDESETIRVNISLPKSVHDLAHEIMRIRRIKRFSVLLQILIREEWRREGDLLRDSHGVASPPSSQTGVPAHYGRARRRRPKPQ